MFQYYCVVALQSRYRLSLSLTRSDNGASKGLTDRPQQQQQQPLSNGQQLVRNHYPHCHCVADNGTILSGVVLQCVQSVSAGELPLPVILFADTDAAAQLFAACPVLLLLLLPPSDTIALTTTNTLDKERKKEKRLRSRRSSSG